MPYPKLNPSERQLRAKETERRRAAARAQERREALENAKRVAPEDTGLRASVRAIEKAMREAR